MKGKIITSIIALLGIAISAHATGIKPLGHGVVCDNNQCVIPFNKTVNYIGIYRYHCKKADVCWRTAFYVDLGGDYPNTAAYDITDKSPKDFLYRVVSASHYVGW